MSIKEFLKDMDIDQLRVANRISKEMIEAKEKEEKVQLYVVSDGIINYSAHRQQDYEAAIESLQKVAEGKKNDDYTKIYGIELRLDINHYRESEVEDMLSLNREVI